MIAHNRVTDALEAAGYRVEDKHGYSMAQCPVHGDNKPSMSVRQLGDRARLKCFAQDCDDVEILERIGLTIADLFDSPKGSTYEYRYLNGNLERTVTRPPNKTGFWQKLEGATPEGQKRITVPYHAAQIQPAISIGETIYLVEGEADVHAAESLDYTATTYPGGAGMIGNADFSFLYNANVIAVVDKDDAGVKWANAVRDGLSGKAKSLEFMQAKTGKDLSDHIMNDHMIDELEYANLPVPPTETEMAEPGSVPDWEDSELLNFEIRRTYARAKAELIVKDRMRAEQQTDSGEYRPGAEFILDTPELPTPIWGADGDVFWAEGESLLISASPGVGKTTLAAGIVRARLGIGTGNVLGLPVAVTNSRVLYLAMDRPQQIRRNLNRLFQPEDREILHDRFRAWEGPPAEDFAKNTNLMLEMAEQAGADTIIVDSLKDAAIGLSEDSVGAGYNRARQKAIAAGIQPLELHHNRKQGSDGSAMDSLDDVYGSRWITAGAGSVIALTGNPGDAVIGLKHLKQPSNDVGPLRLHHNSLTGEMSVYHSVDLVAVAQSEGKITAKRAARAIHEKEDVSANEVEKARRKLDALQGKGLLEIIIEGKRGGDSTTWAVPTTLRITG